MKWSSKHSIISHVIAFLYVDSWVTLLHDNIHAARQHSPNSTNIPRAYNRRPRRPPFRRVESVGTGVTSSMRPIFKPERARARRADWAPGPGVLVLLPPVARNLTWTAVIPRSLTFSATSWAANIAAYGDDSSRSALTFMPPVIRQMVSLPLRSVTCYKWQMTKTSMWDVIQCTDSKRVGLIDEFM